MWLAILLAALSMTTPELQVVQPHGRVRLLVTGDTGSGKSEFTRAFIDPVWRVALYDAEGEYGEYRWMYVDEFAARWQEFRWGVLKLAVRPRPGREEMGKEGEHELFCKTCWRIGAYGSPLLTVHEEVSGYAGPSPSQTFPWFKHLIVRGRKRGISMLVTGQFLHLFPTAYRNNASRVIVYSLPNELARDALGELLGADAGKIDELTAYQFIDWTRLERARVRAPLALRRST